MSLHSISISNLRIIDREELEFSEGLNFFYGRNGSGKTTILEAIYLLSTTRSFRCRNFSDYLRKGEKILQLNGKVISGSRTIPLGLLRDEDSVEIRADGKSLQKVSELASWLPVQLIYSDSHLLISGGPKIRRAFLDWGLFHVEPQFLPLWRRYDKALKHRNALLKQRSHRGAELNRLLKPWNHELGGLAMAIHHLRERYIEHLLTILPDFVEKTMEGHQIALHYQAGWDLDQRLEEQLSYSLDQDLRRGFTQYGAHRAELLFRFDGQEAKKVLSRGQQKMVVVLLSLTQAQQLKVKTNRSSIILIDDLSAELDQEHRQKVMSLLKSMSVQLFITAIEREALALTDWNMKKNFHVEQGHINEVL